MYILSNNTLVLQAGNFGFVDGFADNKITPGSIDFNLYSNPFSKWGRFGMINNSSAAVSPFNFASFPAYAAIRNVTINQNTESIFCAGRDYIAKSNDGMYSNRYYLSKNNEAFELAIEHETVTLSDKVATFQNKTGTVALLSDIGLAGIYGANGTVLSNHVATITDQLTFTGGPVRFGNTLEANSISNFGSIGTHSHTLATSALYFRTTTAGNIATIVNATAGRDIAMSIGGVENWRFKSDGTLQSSTATVGLKLRLHTAGYGLGVSSELLEITGKDATSAYTFGYGTSGSLTRLMTLSGAGDLGVGINTLMSGRVHIKGSSLQNSLVLEDSLGTVWVRATDSKVLEVTGDIETKLSTTGLIVLDRTNGTRYRIYTDGGVLNTEAA